MHRDHLYLRRFHGRTRIMQQVTQGRKPSTCNACYFLYGGCTAYAVPSSNEPGELQNQHNTYTRTVADFRSSEVTVAGKHSGTYLTEFQITA